MISLFASTFGFEFLYCFSLSLSLLKDITSSSDLNKAYIYDTPTIVNFFNSSQPDILVATSSGLVYAFSISFYSLAIYSLLQANSDLIGPSLSMKFKHKLPLKISEMEWILYVLIHYPSL